MMPMKMNTIEYTIEDTKKGYQVKRDTTDTNED